MLQPLPVDYLLFSGDGSGVSCPCNDWELRNGTYTCGLCSTNIADLACYDLPRNNATDPVLYAVKDCRGNCPAATNDSYYVDQHSVCCALSDMDCSGHCGGNETIAYSNGLLGVTESCCEESLMDCEGVCGGGEEYDHCYVCGGTDFTGAICFNQTSVSISALALYPIFDFSSMEGLVQNLSLTLFNDSPDVIEVTVQTKSTDSASDAPVITYPTAAFTVQPNNNSTFSVLASVESLVEGLQSKWAVKTVQVTYVRDGDSAHPYYISVALYPDGSGCESVEGIDTCSTLPGCVFCIVDPNVRILRDAREDEAVAAYRQQRIEEHRFRKEREQQVLDSSSGSSGARRLFTYLIPSAYRNHDKYYGECVCVSSWDVSTCKDADVVASANSAAAARSRIGTAVISIVLTAIISVFTL